MNVRNDDIAAQLRRHLGAELTREGDLRTAEWRQSVEMVPREVFLGDHFFRRIDGASGTMWEPITPSDGKQWLSLAYENVTWVTQLDGQNTSAPSGPVAGAPTSSSTLPGLVVRMLEDLQVDDDSRVLEIGTGTGYSTALLAERLGADRVTSIEVDPHVADRAREALHRAGYRPRLVVGDGLVGHEEGGPYDRVIATCSVRYIPAAWLVQARRGGIVLATLSGWLFGSGLARLTVTGPSSAEGEFLPGTVSFMSARPHAGPPLGELPDREDGEERAAVYGGEVLEEWTSRWIAQLAAPGAQQFSMRYEDGPMTHWLIDQAAGSWAWLAPAGDGWTVRQGGPRRLWDDIESAIGGWRRASSPPQQAFRIRITSGEQVVFLPGARTLRWVLPG
ncbi:ATP-grasp peptide maturase system methyltransferase [Microtetraspora niveoalba]|uniref:ATP-grasp peptide maturase system methyltransferase n=1 Tax=Microtetraspora niveoalba TaxID=46175 RepID=UPI00082F03CC|nr:ATP-grasp peptide maturase system methyltransferase [Microtetraspora niveoalba]